MPKQIYVNDALFDHIKAFADQQNKTIDAIAEELLIKSLPASKPAESEKVYSKEDEEKVKERLRGLGYLD